MIDILTRWLRLYSMKRWLRFWASALVALLGLLVLFTLYFGERSSHTLETNRRLQETVNTQRLAVESWIGSHTEAIRYLARMLSGSRISGDDAARLFTSFMYSQSQFVSVDYVDVTGTTVFRWNNAPQSNVTGELYFQAAREGRESVSGLLRDPATGRSSIVFASPVRDEAGAFNGLVRGILPIEKLEEMVRSYDLGSSGDLYIIDERGRFLTTPAGSSSSLLGQENRSPAAERAFITDSPDKPYRDYKGQQVLGRSASVNAGAWILVAEYSLSALMAPIYWRLLLIGLLVGGVMVLSLLLMMALNRRIEKPIQLLQTGTKVIRDGGYDYQIDREAIRHAPTELVELCETFNRMSQKLKSTIQLLEQTAVIDQLTEVYNRRFMMNEGAKLLEACVRAQQPCTVLMIDIDHFKKINDTYGHLVGDRVIIFAASVLMACTRQSDMVSRYGGEEFMILAPHTKADPGGLQLAERIRGAFAEHSFLEDGMQIPLSVSIGVSDYRTDGGLGAHPLEDMISRADQALYRAKRGGRNRVET